MPCLNPHPEPSLGIDRSLKRGSWFSETCTHGLKGDCGTEGRFGADKGGSTGFWKQKEAVGVGAGTGKWWVSARW